jgi:methionyl-tRNA formyltransferase
MQSAILEGLDETGVTIMRMDEGLDTGDMISKVKVDIRGKDIIEVADLLADSGADLLIATIPMIENGTAAYKPQNSDEATYSGLIKKADGFTDFNESAEQIERKIRAYADWPSCYTYIDGGLQLKLYKAEAIPGDNSGCAPGTVSATDKHSYTISCRNGSLKVLEQQLQGKKRMSAGDFMRGHKIEPGDRFCVEEGK